MERVPDCVQLDGLVLLKIIKHCRENLPYAVSGQLLGLDVHEKLEVTGCFPMPSASSTTKGEDSSRTAESEEEKYQVAMMKLLREVNADCNSVGWYQVCLCLRRYHVP
jgi:translation initiation factor 3 subunit H